MSDYYLDGYDDFECIADKCPSTCCANWQIFIDDSSAKKYLADPKIGAKTKQYLRGNKGSYHFALKNGKCPFLEDDGLCEIIKTNGLDCLCSVCSLHPRFEVEIVNDVVHYLSLSCPKACEDFIELSKQKQIGFTQNGEFIPNEWGESAQDYIKDITQKASKIHTIFKTFLTPDVAKALSNLFSSFEYITSLDKTNYENVTVEKLNYGYEKLKDGYLIPNLITYFACVYYRETKSVIEASIASVLAIANVIGTGEKTTKAIYDYCALCEHSSINEKKLIARALSPLFSRAIDLRL